MASNFVLAPLVDGPDGKRAGRVERTVYSSVDSAAHRRKLLEVAGAGPLSIRENLQQISQWMFKDEWAKLLGPPDTRFDPQGLETALLDHERTFGEETGAYVRALLQGIRDLAESATAYARRLMEQYSAPGQENQITDAVASVFDDFVTQLLQGGVPPPIGEKLRGLEWSLKRQSPPLNRQQQAAELRKFDDEAQRFWMQKYGGEWNPNKSSWKFWERIKIVFTDREALQRYAPPGTPSRNIDICYLDPNGVTHKFELSQDRRWYRLDNDAWQRNKFSGPLSMVERINNSTQNWSSVVLAAG